MKKTVLKQQRSIQRIVITTALIIAFIIAGQFVYYGHINYEKKINHQKVMDLIDNELTYVGADLDEQLDLVLEWIDSKHLSNEDLGRLYERASLIYQQQGAEMTYYRYLGYALYYLEHSSNKDYTINIYLDLANFYANNFSFERAQSMLDKALSIKAFEDIENLQVKSYAFRLRGILESIGGNNEEAEEQLLKSIEILDAEGTEIYKEAYTAMSEVWLAYIYLVNDRADEGMEIMQKYENSPLLTQEIYREILLRDFVVPYYETKTGYLVSIAYEESQKENPADYQQKAEVAVKTLYEFIDICEENGYEKHELNLLLTLQSRYPVSDPDIKNMVYAKLDELYTKLMNIQNESYASIIDSQIVDSESIMEEYEISQEGNTYRNILAIVIACILLAGVSTVHILIIYNKIDGLSNLLNRKRLDRTLARIKTKGASYTIIMIDIDNFKSINDNYGHSSGDIVIQRLGEILQRENKKSVKAFRYGGEEFTLLIVREAQKRAKITAERVRMTMENEIWDFAKDIKITLSIGIANGRGAEDVMKKADENLYLSKQTGKNKITM